jgi:hypothetical protein
LTFPPPPATISAAANGALASRKRLAACILAVAVNGAVVGGRNSIRLRRARARANKGMYLISK